MNRVKKNSWAILGAAALGLYFLTRNNNASSGGTIGGPTGPGDTGGKSLNDQLKDLLGSIVIAQDTSPTSGIPSNSQSNSGYSLPPGISPADAGNLGGGRSMNTQEVMFKAGKQEMGLAPGASIYVASSGIFYQNVGGVIYASNRTGATSTPTAQQLQLTFGAVGKNQWGEPVSVAVMPGRTGPGILAGTTSKYFR